MRFIARLLVGVDPAEPIVFEIEVCQGRPLFAHTASGDRAVHVVGLTPTGLIGHLLRRYADRDAEPSAAGAALLGVDIGVW